MLRETVIFGSVMLIARFHHDLIHLGYLRCGVFGCFWVYCLFGGIYHDTLYALGSTIWFIDLKVHYNP